MIHKSSEDDEWIAPLYDFRTVINFAFFLVELSDFYWFMWSYKKRDYTISVQSRSRSALVDRHEIWNTSLLPKVLPLFWNLIEDWSFQYSIILSATNFKYNPPLWYDVPLILAQAKERIFLKMNFITVSRATRKNIDEDERCQNSSWFNATQEQTRFS